MVGLGAEVYAIDGTEVQLWLWKSWKVEAFRQVALSKASEDFVVAFGALQVETELAGFVSILSPDPVSTSWPSTLVDKSSAFNASLAL